MHRGDVQGDAQCRDPASSSQAVRVWAVLGPDLIWARAAVTAGCSAHANAFEWEIRQRRCAAPTPLWPCHTVPRAPGTGLAPVCHGLSQHSATSPHSRAPFCEMAPCSEPKPSDLPPPSRAFCYFYQERGDFLPFFLPPVRRKGPKGRAQGRALLRMRAVTRGTCHT